MCSAAVVGSNSDSTNSSSRTEATVGMVWEWTRIDYRRDCWSECRPELSSQRWQGANNASVLAC
jgi:hypothetical protein